MLMLLADCHPLKMNWEQTYKHVSAGRKHIKRLSLQGVGSREMLLPPCFKRVVVSDNI